MIRPQVTLEILNFSYFHKHAVKNKTGYNLVKNPYWIGNTIIFIPNTIKTNCFQYNGDIDRIEVKGLNGDNITIVKFKKFDLFTEAYVINGLKCEVCPRRAWQNFDIEVYEYGNIVYAEYDTYLINYEIVVGIERLRDILKILIKNRNVKKNTVFEIKEINGALDNFISKINDDELNRIYISFNGLNMKFYGTSEYFDDRFFFYKNKKWITGYLIRTSLNSFGENYSTLLKLKSSDAEVVSNKIIDNKSI